MGASRTILRYCYSTALEEVLSLVCARPGVGLEVAGQLAGASMGRRLDSGSPEPLENDLCFVVL